MRDSTEERAVHLEAAAPAAATAPDAAEASGAVATTAAQRNNAVTGGRQEQRHPVVVQGAQRHSSIALSAAGAAGAQIEKALGQAASAKAATTRGTRAEQNARREAAAAAVDPPQSGAWHQQPLTPELAQQLSRQHMRAQVNEVYRSATGSSATGIPAQSDGCTAANANTAAAASTVVAAFVPAQSNERTTANAPTSADASADAAAVVHVPAPVATPQRLAASRSAQAEAELAAVEKVCCPNPTLQAHIDFQQSACAPTRAALGTGRRTFCRRCLQLHCRDRSQGLRFAGMHTQDCSIETGWPKERFSMTLSLI